MNERGKLGACVRACVCYWRRSLPVVHTRTRLFLSRVPSLSLFSFPFCGLFDCGHQSLFVLTLAATWH